MDVPLHCIRIFVIQVGVVLFGTFPLDIIELGETNYPQVLDQRITDLQQPIKQGTGTARAIERMRVMFGTSSEYNNTE